MIVEYRIEIIFCFEQITYKEKVGTITGFIYNCDNKQNDTPQDSPEGAWLVPLISQSKEIQKQYMVTENSWVNDTSLKVTVIEW